LGLFCFGVGLIVLSIHFLDQATMPLPMVLGAAAMACIGAYLLVAAARWARSLPHSAGSVASRRARAMIAGGFAVYLVGKLWNAMALSMIGVSLALIGYLVWAVYLVRDRRRTKD